MSISTLNYFNSRDIKVYPTARRGTYNIGEQTYNYDPEARLDSEYNIVNNFSKAVDKQSYIVSYSNTDNLLKCVIGGYYFEITNLLTDGKKPQYLLIKTASVDLVNTTADARATKLLTNLSTSASLRLDDGGYFRGLAYATATDDTDVSQYIFLKLFNDTDCTQLNQEAYLLSTLVRQGSGAGAIVGTYNVKANSTIINPNQMNINVGTGDYSITFGQDNTNAGNYSLVYGKNITNNGANNIVIVQNDTENTITGENNILIGTNIINATHNQLILNQIDTIKIGHGYPSLIESNTSSFKLNGDAFKLTKTGLLTVKTTAANANILELKQNTNSVFTVDTEGNLKAIGTATIGTNSGPKVIIADGVISGVNTLTLNENGTINNLGGTINAKTINATGTVDANSLVSAMATINGDMKVTGNTKSKTIQVTETATITGKTTTENIEITAPDKGIVLGTGNKKATIKYNTSTERLEIIC